jgi:hypothetical protein
MRTLRAEKFGMSKERELAKGTPRQALRLDSTCACEPFQNAYQHFRYALDPTSILVSKNLRLEEAGTEKKTRSGILSNKANRGVGGLHQFFYGFQTFS